MLRTILADAAVAAAKAQAHATVEPRHVIFAIARRFRERQGGQRLLHLARAGLEPRGEAVSLPRMTDEAAALLDTIHDDGDALSMLRSFFANEPEQHDGGTASASGATETADEAQHDTVTTQPAESVSTVLADLDALVGLAHVKTQVRSVIALVQANQERRRAGLAPIGSSLHLVFTGPPGTGKTTVARLVARLYAATGALPGANFMEASRSDLVAGYVGQTALKTADVIAKTRPGVLFIDEAYSLTPTHSSDFGGEAIATLVKAMEDFRGDLAVIAAGYTGEMTEFIASNPGLRSRFQTFIDFPDYTPAELVQIFARYVHDNGMELGDGVLDEAERIFQRVAGRADFGNARFARALFERAYTAMAVRAAEDGVVTLDEITVLQAADLDCWEIEPPPARRPVGFELAAAPGAPAG